MIKHYPFRKFEMVKPNPPKKRNIYLENIRKIMNLEKGLRRQELARDVFMLSFFLVGMNTVDMFNVPYSSRKNGRITYQRSKTKNRREDNAEISIKIDIPLPEHKDDIPTGRAEMKERYARHREVNEKICRSG